MNELRTFKNDEFGEVRTLVIDGEPYFVGKDVAEILGYSNSRKAIGDHVDEEDKVDGVTIRDSIGRDQKPILINESGLYSLILSSKLPNAKKFKHWVTSDVLPSIRKTGAYQKPLSRDQLIAQALIEAQAVIEEKDNRIKEMRPKEIFSDAVATSKTSILIGELAKLLKQNGIEIGQKRLFAWMRNNGYLMKSGSSKNMPTQRAMQLGLFEIKEGSYINGNGASITTKTTKVTGKGQIYFINKFLGDCNE
jgi:anti-repressor protein